MNNRLQFRHHSEIFDTREAAIAYIQNGIQKTSTGLAAENQAYGFSLLAEPTVLLYKNEEDETTPHMILAVGTCTNSQGQYVDNRFCFIDVDNTNADFESYKTEIAALIKSMAILTEDTDSLQLTKSTTEDGTTISGNVKIADSYLFDNVKKGNIILTTENGLYTYVDISFDKDNNKISYQINGNTDDFVIPNNHLVSGEYSVEDESLHFKLSESTEEIVVSLEALLDEWDVDKNPSTPIVLKKETIGYGSTQGHNQGSHLEPWQDILSADVTLSDNEYNILTKSNNGKALYVKGTADNIKYFKNGKEITVAQALDSCLDVSSDNENIIYKKEDGFAASVSIKYEKSENAIYFYKSNKKGEKEETKLALNSTNLTNSYYDSKNERIVLQFITATGDLDTRYIDLSSIFDLEWDVKNEGHSVTLVKTRQESNKADILSADVKISDADNNILVEKDHALYVKTTLSYDESSNKIKFSTSNGDTEFQIKGVSFIDDARYDHQSEQIIITYHTANQDEPKTLEIDVKDLIKEWEVTSDTSGAIKLSQNEDVSTGRHIISASTIINTTHSDNMLVNDNGSLYVSSAKIDENTKSIEQLSENVAENAANLSQEIQRAKEAEADLQEAIESLSPSGSAAEFADSTTIKFDKTGTGEKATYTANVKLASTSDNVLTVQNDGIYLSERWDCGEYLNGTEIDIETYFEKFVN